jgi:competence protein ComEC
MIPRVGVVCLSLLCGCTVSAGTPPADPAQAASAEVVVRVLDVGQGDATLIENGGSRALIDGGPDIVRMGRLLDSLQLNDSTIDVVVLTHQHADHLIGLRALFESKRHITIRYLFENRDLYTTTNLRLLRDSINARVARGELIVRDTDDPCNTGASICTITMKGGAKLHIMRPMPGEDNPNNRSAPIKLIGPDSASFTMWFAGDAEQEAIGWFLNRARYNVIPGMRANVLKADHHGSCDGVTSAYLNAIQPSLVIASLSAKNSYRHMHTQAKATYRAQQVSWYRTDQNGTVELRSQGTPGKGYRAAVQRGEFNSSGPSDQRSTQPQCNPVP